MTRLSPIAAFALAAFVSTGLLAPEAHAFGDASRFSFAVLRHGGNFDPRPNGLRRIAWEVAKRTSIEVVLEPKVLDLTDPELFRHPFLVLSGDGAFPPFGEAEVGALRRYLTYGGFLLVDDASGQPGGDFERSVRRELAAALPTATIGVIPKDHVLYKAFYLLDGPRGRVRVAQDAQGVALQGRLAVVMSPNDLQGAVARGGLGDWEFEIEGGSGEREMAMRFGINLVMYALCLDYKDDQVHLPFIMQRRR